MDIEFEGMLEPVAGADYELLDLLSEVADELGDHDVLYEVLTRFGIE